jgi:hypothetical protein
MKSILAIIIILLTVLHLWWMQAPKPHFSHPDMTQEERQKVKKAILKHGNYPLTREGETGRYIMHIKGRKVTI